MKTKKTKIIYLIQLLLFCLLSSAPDIYANWPTDRDMNPLHMVVVFTKFKGEAPGDTLAPEWADEIFNGEPGSVNHFYEKVSFGIYRITGEYLPKRYELPDVAEVYVQNRNKYALDVLNLLNNDPDVDFSRFDTDGPDGIPGSSDDDRFVDYMVLMPKTRPYDFILRYATGVWTLGIIKSFKTNNKSSDGFIIQLDKFSGSIATANSKNEAVGTIVAEIGHAYGSGAIDLMDKGWEDNATDSAGVGYWDFLGRGALGWEEQNGPMGPCAFTRIRIDCAGRYNTNLINLTGFNERVPIYDVGKEDCLIYKISVSVHEYFLIEYRRSEGLYYDRYIPQDGLLIWHVLDTETNNNEFKKLCDLECPDGRFLDAGYPLGKKPDPINGGDNLDFWSHNVMYNAVYAGNAGDSFDVYDGVRYTQFGSDTNPNSYSKVTLQKTGIEIFNIRAEGDSMVFDCIIPPFHNWFEEKYPFIGAAYHRFALTGAESSAKPADRELYLVRHGSNRKPGTLVTIDGDELKTESLSLLEGHEIEWLVTQRLLTTEEHFRGSEIIRKNVPLEDFGKTLNNYGLTLSELGTGGNPWLVQKVSCVLNTQNKPVSITLCQNFPNPFNSITTISYALSSEGKVALEVYNILGQRVMLIDEGYKSMGFHAVQLDAGNLASGIYLYRLKGNIFSQTKKFTLIR